MTGRQNPEVESSAQAVYKDANKGLRDPFNRYQVIGNMSVGRL